MGDGSAVATSAGGWLDKPVRLQLCIISPRSSSCWKTTSPLVGVRARLKEALAPGRLRVPTAAQDGGARQGQASASAGTGGFVAVPSNQHLSHRGTQKAVSRKAVLVLGLKIKVILHLYISTK